jgi:hypothetical protein
LRLLIFLVGCGFTSQPNSPDSQCPLHHLAGFYYCDGFEDGLDSRYFVSGDNGRSAIDGVRAYRGKTSLHLHADEGAGDGGGTLGADVVASSSDFVNIDPAESDLRVYMYVVGPAVSGTVRLLTLGGLQLYLVDGDLVVGFDHVATMPLDRWVCVQMKMATPGGPWIGSVAIDNGVWVTMGTSFGNEPNGFSLTLQHNDPMPAMDVWFDEVVLDHHAIGCGS